MRRSYYCDDGDNSGETGYDEFKYGYDAYNRQISYYNYEVAQHSINYIKWASESDNSWDTYSGSGKYVRIRR